MALGTGDAVAKETRLEQGQSPSVFFFVAVGGETALHMHRIGGVAGLSRLRP